MTDIDSLLFKIEMSQRAPHAGALLIAEPFLREEYFCHAVICIIEYDADKSTMGIVMNKPTGYTLNTLINQVSDHVDIPVYCGGPLSCDRLYFIHTLGNMIPDAQKISDGLYIGGDFDTTVRYLNMGLISPSNIRFFLGYSGWDPGQLNDEIKQHVWAVSLPSHNEDLFNDDGDKYWHQHVKAMGDEYKGWKYHPENPLLN